MPRPTSTASTPMAVRCRCFARESGRSDQSQFEAIEGRRSLREQRGLLGLAVLRGKPLEGVEDHLIAALALVGRKVALEHRAIGPERLDACLYIRPPGGCGLVRRWRLVPQVEVITKEAHRKPAELDHHVGAFGDVLDRGLPDRKSLFPLA